MLNLKPYNELLYLYVDRLGKINYQTWKMRSRDRLTQWLQELSQIDPQKYSDDERLALWINLYNALVITEVLKICPIDLCTASMNGRSAYCQTY